MEKIRIIVYPGPDGVLGRVVVYPERRSADERSPSGSYDFRLNESISRSKSIRRELSICNPWDYFCTFTFDSDKVNRYDYQEVSHKLQVFFNNYRKRYSSDFRYMVVPECHVDGAVHFHGLIRCVRPGDIFVPDKVLKRVDDDDPSSPFDTKLIFVPNTKGYLRWSNYRLGYLDLSPVRDHFRVSSYIIKYMSKSMQSTSGAFLNKGDHIVLHSQGLRRSLEYVKEDLDYSKLYDVATNFMGDPLAFEFCDVYQDVPLERIDEFLRYI